MTCEVAVANTLAIALAADSAVTFSAEGAQNTYASGANKIFQLAHSEPVAVMIYNNANLTRVPWEVILKAYRSRPGEHRFLRLQDYCEDLVQFINTCSEDLIPSVLKEDSSKQSYGAGVLLALKLLVGMHPNLLAQDSQPEVVRDEWQRAILALDQWLDGEPVSDSLDEGELNAEIHKCSQGLAEEVVGFLARDHVHSALAPYVDARQLAAVGIKLAFKKSYDVVGNQFTGVVIAGFGQDDYMPGYADTKFYTFIGSRVLYKRDTRRSVNHSGTSSIIEAFARRAMVETFTQGASPEVWTAVGNAFSEYASRVCRSACQAAGIPVQEQHISAALEEHSQEFTTSWTQSVFADHLRPLWSVVASLSVSELAELAETLVLLESLKEKVTQRTQSVGGPIDVAVITKAEGLVWIKRKLYFEPQLNYRYFRRLDASEGLHHAR